MEEVSDSKTIDYSREDEEKKKMYRDIRDTHTARKKVVFSINFRNSQIQFRGSKVEKSENTKDKTFP